MNTILAANSEDFKEINQLLLSEDLPEIDDAFLSQSYLKVRDNLGQIIGAIGLEQYGKYGLLRSMVVAKEFRDQGIAMMLIKNIKTMAEQLSLTHIYLLTTTADAYFVNKGFQRIDRSEVPDNIKKSQEFSSVCPVSAIMMKYNL